MSVQQAGPTPTPPERTSRCSHGLEGAAPASGLGRFSSADGWSLVQTDFSLSNQAQDETLFALSNGLIGLRGGLEEAASGSDGCFHADVFEQTPIAYHERFKGFADRTDTRVGVAHGQRIDVIVDGEKISSGDWTIAEFERRLDLRSGQLRRRTLWRSAAGVTVEIVATRLVSLIHTAVAATRYRVRAIDRALDIALTSRLDGSAGPAAESDDPRISARQSAALPILHSGPAGAALGLVQATRRSNIRIACAQLHDSAETAGAHADDAGVAHRFKARLEAGQTLTLDKVVAHAVSDGTIPPDALLQQAARAADEAVTLGYDALAAEQARLLGDFWSRADIELAGQPALTLALRFNLFHLLQSAARDDRHSAAAKGLTGEGYEGHYFWDTEAYLLPALALTEPERARNMLAYRIGKLDRARAHARGMGHLRGALFPWRTIAGDECSAHYPTGSAQYHINADIAFALELYGDATGDETLLAAGGAELLFETARIWLEVGHFNPARGGAFTIHEVTGPDEYTGLVNNNAYTNSMARRHLRFAVRIATRMQALDPARYAALAASLALTESEIASWARAADTMFIPYDRERRITAQDDGFLDKPLWDFAATPADHYPLLLHYHPLTLFRHQLCKQGDVVLAHVLAGERVSRSQKQRDFAYYEPLTAHDSTLSASTFAVMAAEIGQTETFCCFLAETSFVDLNDSHGNASHGAHMAAMAGSWQALVWGAGGFRPNGPVLDLAPTCPQGWSGFRFRIVWRSRTVEVTVDRATTRYRLLAGAPLDMLHHGAALTLSDSAERPTVAMAAAQTPDWAAVIFDLDGVLTDTARAHYRAWKRLADELGLPFDEAFNEQLKGVDRLGSLERILARGGREASAEERSAWAARKNGYYLDEICSFGPSDLFPGARDALLDCRRNGLKIGLASASRNAPRLLRQLGIADLFDAVADAGAVARGKPDPEIFLAAAELLGVPPGACLAIEDSVAGLAAIKAAGMHAIGIGDPALLRDADAVLPDIAAFRVANWLDRGPP